MQDSKYPPGYVPLTHHNLAGFSANGEGKSMRQNNGGGRQRQGGEGNNGGGRGRRPEQQRRPMKPRMNGGGMRD